MPSHSNNDVVEAIAADILALVPQAEKLTGKGHSMYYAEATEARNLAELAEIRDELAEIVGTARAARSRRWGEVIDEWAYPIIVVAVLSIVFLVSLAA